MAIEHVERAHGKGAIMRIGDQAHRRVPVIPSGDLGLDAALGVGGYPRGRIIEVFGPEASGKTTLTLHAVAQVQKRGGVAAFIDVEHALDVLYAGRIGVKAEDLLVSQPDYGEQALDIAELLVRSGAVDIVVIDSVAALVPRAELEGDMGDAHMALQARLMSQALRKLTGVISKSHTTMIFINQLRHKVGLFYGSPETTTGGNALKFYCSQRLDVRRIGAIKDGDTVLGNRVRVKVVKNKVSAPFRQAEFDILLNTGISAEGSLIDLGVEHKLVKKAGAWYSLGDQRLGQGRENARRKLIEDGDVAQRLDTELRQLLDLPSSEEQDSDFASMEGVTPVAVPSRKK